MWAQCCPIGLTRFTDVPLASPHAFYSVCYDSMIWVNLSHVFYCTYLLSLPVKNVLPPGFKISNWMHLDCKNTCPNVPFTCLKYIKPMQLMWKSEIHSLSSHKSCRYSTRPSVRPSVRPTVSTKKQRCKWRIFFKFCTQVCLGVPSINLLFVLSYLIKYAHNSIISDFSIFGIHRVIF